GCSAHPAPPAPAAGAPAPGGPPPAGHPPPPRPPPPPPPPPPLPLTPEAQMLIKPGLPAEQPSDDPLPAVIQGYISVQGPSSVFDRSGGEPPGSTKAYHAKKADRDTARRDLEKTGFTILAESQLGVAV